jgi:predicted AlkP superfamily phosphohydrolase/phosphomutase
VGARARVLVIGLDSVSPELLFDRFRDCVPRILTRIAGGAHGVLKSCDPPITVPAWAVMFTGMDAGCLGIYGFRNRARGTYFGNEPPRPSGLPYPPIWDVLSRAGRRVCIIGVPPGYPPPAVNGIYVSDLLTPPGATDFVTPATLAPEIERVTGGYRFDVPFRKEARAEVAAELEEMTRRRWKLACELWGREAWDLFVVHEIGPDRLHHAFWKYFDPAHPRHDPDPAFQGMAERYYRLLDESVGALLDAVPEEVTVFVVSDHGSQAMAGAVCINEWLRREGYLTLRSSSPAGTPLESADVDWSRTRLWGAGGYYARIHLNLAAREPEGIVPTKEADALLDEVTARLSALVGPDGRPIGVEIARPAEVFDEVRGLPPDLLAYFGDLRWRSAGTVGHPGLFLTENDTGPDDAVHSWNGVIAAAGPGIIARGPIGPSRIQDVAPTILAILGHPSPPSMRGRPISPLLGRHHHERR